MRNHHLDVIHSRIPLSHLRERCLSEDITQIPPSSAISFKIQTDRLYWERMESMGDNGCWEREGKRVANVLLVVCWSGRHALPFTSKLIFIITPSMIAVRVKVLDLEQCLKCQSSDKSIESFLEKTSGCWLSLGRHDDLKACHWRKKAWLQSLWFFLSGNSSRSHARETILSFSSERCSCFSSEIFSFLSTGVTSLSLLLPLSSIFYPSIHFLWPLSLFQILSSVCVSSIRLASFHFLPLHYMYICLKREREDDGMEFMLRFPLLFLLHDFLISVRFMFIRNERRVKEKGKGN